MHADRLRLRLRPTRNGLTTLTVLKTIRLAYARKTRIDWVAFGLALAEHIASRSGPGRDKRLIRAKRRRLIAA